VLSVEDAQRKQLTGASLLTMLRSLDGQNKDLEPLHKVHLVQIVYAGADILEDCSSLEYLALPECAACAGGSRTLTALRKCEVGVVEEFVVMASCAGVGEEKRQMETDTTML
jgi:hypothetical protein